MKKILIAETNEVTQRVLQTAFTDLQDFEGEVMFADTPDEAYNLIKIHKPDLFLASDSSEFSDLQELCERVRQIDVAAEIPLVVIFSPDKPVKFEDKNTVKLQKPFSAIKLLGIVIGLLDGRLEDDPDKLFADEKEAESEQDQQRGRTSPGAEKRTEADDNGSDPSGVEGEDPDQFKTTPLNNVFLDAIKDMEAEL